jgi:O-antigen/teichoic acid export membrane protein
MTSTRALSFGLRIAALGARFLLLFWLAFYLPPEDVGLYGLISATIGYSALFLGADFYLYANREFKQAPDTHKFPILRRSLWVYACIYLLVLPSLTLIFIGGLLPWNLVVLFYVILVLEHLGQEAYRLLVMMERVLLAGWVLFLRLGLWAIVFASLMFVSPMFRSIDMLLIAWCIGAFLSICFAIGPLLKLPRSPRLPSPDRRWVIRGLQTALPFFIGTLCLRGMVTFDRYLIEMFTSREILGAYVFMAGMAATLPALLEAGVFAFLSPKLISAAKTGDTLEFQRISKRLLHETAAAACGFAVVSAVLLQLVETMLPNPVYTQNLIIFYLCLVAQLPLSLQMVYHFSLYARHRDRPIILSHISGVIIFITASFMIAQIWPLGAVPIALIAANSTMLAIKFSANRRLGELT